MSRLEFYLFHLMPYPFIPPGEEFESIWITLPNHFYDPRIGHKLYNEYLEQLILAERLGYDGVLVPGGFGERGIEGKVQAIRFAREKGIPFFGFGFRIVNQPCLQGVPRKGTFHQHHWERLTSTSRTYH